MSFTFSAIAHIRNGTQYRFEAPRQAVFANENLTFLEFEPSFPNLQSAIEDLQGFERVWLIFVFHLNVNKSWKPKVRPPLSPNNGRYSVLATRSPHRPNPIGLSCVELKAIDRRGLWIGSCDLLDGTPILDIKPYIPEADAFPDVSAGWRDQLPNETEWQINFTDMAQKQIEFINLIANLDLANFATIQLRHNPLDSSRKRLTPIPEQPGHFLLGCRTWKLRFELNDSARSICIKEVLSNYQDIELTFDAPDRYNDKDFHRSFLKQFPR